MFRLFGAAALAGVLAAGPTAASAQDLRFEPAPAPSPLATQLINAGMEAEAAGAPESTITTYLRELIMRSGASETEAVSALERVVAHPDAGPQVEAAAFQLLDAYAAGGVNMAAASEDDAVSRLTREFFRVASETDAAGGDVFLALANAALNADADETDIVAALEALIAMDASGLAVDNAAFRVLEGLATGDITSGGVSLLAAPVDFGLQSEGGADYTAPGLTVAPVEG